MLASRARKVFSLSMLQVDLSSYGIETQEIIRNAPPSQLYIEAIRHEPDSSISDTGALIAYSGEKTGRSPGDKRIVSNKESEGDIWWGNVNIPIDEETFLTNRELSLIHI